MSRVAQQPKPTTETGLSKDLKIAQLLKTYPESLFRGIFEEISSKTVKYSTQNIGRMKSCSRFLFEMSDQSRHIRITDQWEIDLTATTINLTTKTGGIVDDIARADGETYLVWAFLDEGMRFAGLGATRKPRSSFSAIAGGSANKGATNKDFTVTNAYQFIPGALVCVRNDVGTAPAYEWNWATVDSIQSSTVVRLDMKNETYGTNINGVKNGEILQWDSFQPYVVSSTAQTLYQPYYSLVGELYTDESTGDIERAYRADEEFREAKYDLVYNSTANVSGSALYLGRWIPLWSDRAMTFVFGQSTTAGHLLYFGNSVNTAVGYIAIQTAGVNNGLVTPLMVLDQDAKLLITSNLATTVQVSLTGYTTKTGMKV